ncbi:unnamed protein product, partial [Ectocarpus sp. 4 AP-2014]
RIFLPAASSLTLERAYVRKRGSGLDCYRVMTMEINNHVQRATQGYTCNLLASIGRPADYRIAAYHVVAFGFHALVGVLILGFSFEHTTNDSVKYGWSSLQ